MLHGADSLPLYATRKEQTMVQMHHPELVAAAQEAHGESYDPAKLTGSCSAKAFAKVWEPKGYVQGPAPAAKKTAAKGGKE